MKLKKAIIASSLYASIALGGAALLTPAVSFAYDVASTAAINVNAEHVILSGYDAVSYFQGKPTPGNKKFAAEHNGARYHFASESNLKAFQADPARYAPQFGGFCAMGAALGKKLDVDPNVYQVVDGKLYLNINKDVFVKWSEDVPGNIVKANANWPAIKDKAPSSL